MSQHDATPEVSWGINRRLDRIDWCLCERGKVNRADLTEVFGVTLAQASADIGLFNKLYPNILAYNNRSKFYFSLIMPYVSQRNMNNPTVRAAIRLLSTVGHPMGWK